MVQEAERARGTAGSQEENQPVVDARYGSHGFEPFRFEFHFVVLLIVDTQIHTYKEHKSHSNGMRIQPPQKKT